MFETAYQTAGAFTNPIVISRRVGGGDVATSIGAYVVLNETWALTAAHMIQMVVHLRSEQERWRQCEQELADVESDESIDKGRRRSAIRKIKSRYKPDSLATHYSQWFGHDDIRMGGGHIDVDVDLAAFEYTGAPDGWGQPFPFLRQGPFRPGVSVLRYGYPFHAVAARFDETSGSFHIEDGVPVPVFPIEGISTRRATLVDHPAYPRVMLETSSPGLRGQSGGPIVDQAGTVWAIQSRTAHLALGFNPKISSAGREVEEHQFLNVGLGADAETVKGFLDSHGIDYQVR